MQKKINKKYIFIFLMLLLCVGLYYGVKGVQNYYYNKEDTQNKVAAVKKSSIETSAAKQDNSNQGSSNFDSTKSNASKGSDASSTGSKSSQNSGTKSSAANSGSSGQNQPAGSTTGSETGSASIPKQPVQQSNCSVVIYDDVHKKTILSVNITIDGETSVEIITQQVLKKYNIHFIDSGGYFREIEGLAERKAGPYSGWCYYVNGVKAGRGAGSYILKKGDKLEWEYLADGLSN